MGLSRRISRYDGCAGEKWYLHEATHERPKQDKKKGASLRGAERWMDGMPSMRIRGAREGGYSF